MKQLPHWLQAIQAGMLVAFYALLEVMRTPMFRVVAVCLALFVFPAAWFLGTMPDISLVEHYKPWESIRIFDKNNKIITTVSGDEDRVYVPLKNISKAMQQAVISAEDRRFYQHQGADVSSLLRAAATNMSAGRIVEGGSTISQQLVKNLFFKMGDRSYERKARELVLALQLENRYPKDKILEMYLNQVYFGRGAYGIEVAARNYFGKTASQLNTHEAAFLAGLLKAPSQLSRPENLKDANRRKEEVLARMAEDGYFNPQELESLQNKKLDFKQRPNLLQKYPYYISYVLEELQKMKVDIHQGQGLKVYTYLDPAIQQSAEKALNSGIKKAPKGINQGALVTVDVQTGGVLAMVGGVGPYAKHQWNRAVSGHTAGSSFKPFVYLAAFEQGLLSPDDVISDDPIVIPQKFGPAYAPKNFDGEFKGPLPVTKALAYSRNTCAVRAAQLAGVSKVVNVARRAGITTKLDPYISLALGSASVTPMEMSGAYASFVRNGVYIKPQVIHKIEDSTGKVVHQLRPKQERRLKPRAVAQLSTCLKQAVEAGTGTKARIPGVPIIGKTGTADGATDVWFVGVTPGEATAVWGGTDKPVHKRNNAITGGNLMAGIWRQHTSSYMHARKETWKVIAKEQSALAKAIASTPEAKKKADKKKFIDTFKATSDKARKEKSATVKRAQTKQSSEQPRKEQQPTETTRVEGKRVEPKPDEERRVEEVPTAPAREERPPVLRDPELHHFEEAPANGPHPEHHVPMGPPPGDEW